MNNIHAQNIMFNNMAALTLNGGPPPDDECLAAFGHSQFKPFQWQIIKSLLEGKDNCAFLTTGYGKSLCYQYPAVFTKRLVVVICPLISLMEHQVECLELKNINAVFLGTAQAQKKTVLNELTKGIYNLVYMTPEFLSKAGGFKILSELHRARNIALVAVDEAHCVSLLSKGPRKGLRPAYHHLGQLRKTLPKVPILALTAVANDFVKQDIIDMLGLKDPQICTSQLDRPNLYFQVEKMTGNVELDKKGLMTLLNREDYDIPNSPVVIYCLTKKNAETIVKILVENKFSVGLYSADKSIDERRNAQRKFLSGEVKIMVATIAFGMGIHMPSVRCVINYGAPPEMEVYYQQAGRAGHDGKPALCITYLCAAQSFVQRGNYNSAMRYFTSTRECRRYHILSYFEKDRKLPTTIRADCCDNCTRKLNSPDLGRYEELDSNGLYDFTEDTAMFLNAVQYFATPVQLKTIVAFLRGTRERSLDPIHHNSDYFGSGAAHDKVWWLEVALILEQANYIRRVRNSAGRQTYPVVEFGERERGGPQWLLDYDQDINEPVLLPPTEGIIQQLTPIRF